MGKRKQNAQSRNSYVTVQRLKVKDGSILEVGTDVSQFDQSRIDSLVERGVVKAVEISSDLDDEGHGDDQSEYSDTNPADDNNQED